MTANGSDQAAALAGYLHYIQDSNGTVSFEMVDIDDDNGGTIPALRFSVSGLQMSMSETDSWYEGITSDKYGFGIDGVTDARRVAVGYDLLGLMQTGGVTNWLDANRTSTIGGISSMIEGMPKLMQMEAVLESKGYNMNRLLNADVDSDEYKAMDELLRGAGYSAAAATQAFDDMNNTLLYDGLRATQAYGESTEEVIQYMQQLEDGASGAAQAFMELASSMDSVKNIQQLMSQYDSGSRNPE